MRNNLEDTIKIENFESTIIQDQELRKLIEFKLDKSNFNRKDLEQIDDIVINGKKINEEINIVNFKDLDLFNNLKKLELKNVDISKENIERLKNIENLSFKNCNIESIEEINKVKKLIINNSNIKHLEQIANFEYLNELELINLNIENFNFLKQLKNLKVLKVKNVKEFSLDKINFPLPINYLSIEGLEKLDINILENYFNLNVLSVDKEKAKEWKETLEVITKKGIKILLNDIYEY